MFSGIVEEKSKIVRVTELIPGRLVRIWVEKPASFDDLALGDSIANDGVCLTVEAFDDQTLQFAIAAETLAVTNWRKAVSDGPQSLVGRTVNLERSLRFGDRIHGHLVSGHVDAAARVVRVENFGETKIVDVEIPPALRSMVWKKGSWALNGVSLTVNSVDGGIASHGLIPETLLRSNLGSLEEGDLVNVEVDAFARSIAHSVDTYLREKSLPDGMMKEAQK